MAQGKVEICGVNTAKLPLLKQQEKEALFLCTKDIKHLMCLYLLVVCLTEGYGEFFIYYKRKNVREKSKMETKQVIIILSYFRKIKII